MFNANDIKNGMTIKFEESYLPSIRVSACKTW